MDPFIGLVRKLCSVTARYALGTITRVATQDSVAALTFDDGPHPEFTPRLLDILATHRARATFFMLGENAHKYPELVRRVVEEGHAIGNHSWNHPSFPLIPGRERRKQIRACASAIEPYGGVRLFRPPYGHQNLRSRLDALWLRYKVVMCDVVAEDWCDRDPEWMADVLVSQIKPGSIVCLHDSIQRSVQAIPQYDRRPMLEAVDRALKRLGDRFHFVTIPELLRHGYSQRENWYRNPSHDMLVRLREHPAVAGYVERSLAR